MAFAIPKIQYKNVDTTGNTVNLNGTISSIPSTADIVVGMFVRGTGIPAGATVGSKTSTSVTLASGVLATANGTGVTLAFGYEILFQYPPKENDGEAFEGKGKTSEALSGVQQTSTDYIEGKRSLAFSFLSQSIYNSVLTFLTGHALYGNDFRYYDDASSVSYITYELDSLKVKPKKIAPKGVDVYVWEIPLSFRRAL